MLKSGFSKQKDMKTKQVDRTTKQYGRIRTQRKAKSKVRFLPYKEKTGKLSKTGLLFHFTGIK